MPAAPAETQAALFSRVIPPSASTGIRTAPAASAKTFQAARLETGRFRQGREDRSE